MRAMDTPAFTAAELAERFALQLHGDGSTRVSGVATLAHAGPAQLAFLANPRYRPQLAGSAAGTGRCSTTWSIRPKSRASSSDM